MRARYPDRTEVIDRGGVQIHYELYGQGGPTLLMIPPAPITHSRIYKALIPHLSRRNRVVTFDPRGNGRSGRPTRVDAYHRRENEADIIAVLDAAGVDRAVLVAHCHANWWAVDVASAHPDRVSALVSISPGVPYLGSPKPHWIAAARHWDDVIEEPSGWELCNRHTIVTEPRRWVDFFFSAQLVEHHSTKQHEDAVDWALETTGEALAAGEEAEDLDPPGRAAFEDQCRNLGVPTLVIHGDQDICQDVSRGREFAEITEGDLVILEGSGHLPLVRDPVIVNRSVTEFVDRTMERP